jgi:hypothetical protein
LVRSEGSNSEIIDLSVFLGIRRRMAKPFPSPAGRLGWKRQGSAGRLPVNPARALLKNHAMKTGNPTSIGDVTPGTHGSAELITGKTKVVGKYFGSELQAYDAGCLCEQMRAKRGHVFATSKGTH